MAAALVPPLRAAVIGVGAMGRNHARVYNELESARLVGVMDADPATAERAGRSFHAPHFSDVAALLDETRPQVVSLAVPTLLLGQSVPDGYARPMMAVESVTTEAGAKVTPVVMTNDKGDAIILMVRTEQQVDPNAPPSPQPDQGADPHKLEQTKPKGGEL